MKGLLHPPDRIIAYLRYYQDNRGARQRGGTRYTKVYGLSERRSILRRKWPRYLYFDEAHGRELQGVPIADVVRIHKPQERLMTVLHSRSKEKLEKSAGRMVQILAHKSGLPLTRFGISGSLLVDLHQRDSDIDIITYGADTARRVQETMLDLLEEDVQFHRYHMRDLRRLYMSRRLRSAIGFKDFAVQERRKALQGSFLDHDYFIRCVKDWHEVTEKYGTVRYQPVGRYTISAQILDDRQSLLTPCKYLLERVEILAGISSRRPHEVVSFRGRFAEQARTGERILARGRLEAVRTTDSRYFRLVVGEGRTDILRRVE